jgi:hypothetical protein
MFAMIGAFAPTQVLVWTVDLCAPDREAKSSPASAPSSAAGSDPTMRYCCCHAAVRLFSDIRG